MATSPISYQDTPGSSCSHVFMTILLAGTSPSPLSSPCPTLTAHWVSAAISRGRSFLATRPGPGRHSAMECPVHPGTADSDKDVPGCRDNRKVTALQCEWVAGSQGALRTQRTERLPLSRGQQGVTEEGHLTMQSSARAGKETFVRQAKERYFGQRAQNVWSTQNYSRSCLLFVCSFVCLFTKDRAKIESAFCTRRMSH